VDAGSGSGVPGIPVKVIQEEDGAAGSLILVDSIQKKARVLSSLVSKMDLSRADVFGDRFESPALLERCRKIEPNHNWILCSKAFASTEQTLAWSELLKPGLKAAYLIKGPAGLAEIQRGALKKLGWTAERTFSFRFPHRESFVIELTPQIS
jgi:16S rRNA G527 N7-methylase RsmG